MSRLRCWGPIALGEHVVLEDGSIEVEHKVLVYGTQRQRGSSGRMHEWTVGDRQAAEMVANYERDRATGYEAPVFLGHPDDRSTAPAVGWVKGIRAAKDGIRALVRYLPKMATAILSGEYLHVSPTFTLDYEDQRAVKRGAKLLDIGVLNTPHQKDLGPIVGSEVAYQLAEVDATDETTNPSGDKPSGDDMDDSKIKELIASTVAESVAALKADLTAAVGAEVAKLAPAKGEPAQLGDATDKINGALIALGKRADNLDAALSQAMTKLEAAQGVAAAAQAETAEYKGLLEEQRVLGLLADGFSNGTLEGKDVPGYGTAEFSASKWLAASKFNGEKGLRMHVATATPVVPVDKRRASAPTGSAQDNSIALGDIQFDAAIFKDRAEFEKFASMGVGGDPRAAQG